MGAERVHSYFLTVLGMEQLSVYQIIFRNLTEVVGTCTMCGTMAHVIFGNPLVFVCSELMYQMNFLGDGCHQCAGIPVLLEKVGCS